MRLVLPMSMLVAALASSLCPPQARADVLYLLNGDQLTGAMTGADGTTVSFHTDYAGDLKVKREALKGIATDKPFEVKLSDGQAVTGRFVLEGETLGLQTDGGFVATPLTSVTSARPGGQRAEKKPKWKGYVESGLTLRSGNTDTADFSFKSGATREGDWTKLTLTLSADYGEAESIINTRRYKGEAQWQGFLTERFYVLGVTSAEQDAGRKLDLRATVGTGVGYAFLKSDKRQLSAEAGLEETWEQWAGLTPQERDATRQAVRNGAYNRLNALVKSIEDNNRFTYQQLLNLRDILRDAYDPLGAYGSTSDSFLSARLSATYSQKLFTASTLTDALVVRPNLEDAGEFRLTNELAFSTPITKALNLRISLESEYDSQADRSDIEAWNNTLKTGLRYEF